MAEKEIGMMREIVEAILFLTFIAAWVIVLFLM